MFDIRSGPLAVVKVKERPRRPQSITVRKRRLSGDYAYRLVNAGSLLVGDELRVEAGKGVKLDVSGSAIVTGSGRRWKVTVSKPGELQVVVSGKPRSRVEISVEEPPLQDPLGMDLCGPGLYRAHAGLDGEPLRRWVDRVAEAGMNYVRVIVPARAWLEGTPQSIFRRLADGRYDLEAVDEEYLERLRADLWYARRRGVVVHVDLFDWHILRHMASWHRSEFCGLRNRLGYPLPSVHYTGRWENAVEHPLKADWDYTTGSPEDRLQRRYADAAFEAFGRIASLVPPGHIVGDGNELEGRTVSRRILDHVRDRYGLLSYGGTPLYHDPHPPETWAQRCERLIRDPQIGWVRCLCLHGARRDNVALRLRRLLPLLEAHPHLQVLFSTDGTGTGSVRGKEGRPTFDELLRIRDRCRQVAGERYGGFGDIKILGRDDARALLAFWSRYGA